MYKLIKHLLWWSVDFDMVAVQTSTSLKAKFRLWTNIAGHFSDDASDVHSYSSLINHIPYSYSNHIPYTS